MERYAPFIEFAIAVTIGVALIIFANPVRIVSLSPNAELPLLSIVPSLSLPPLGLPNLIPQASSETTSTQTETHAPVAKKTTSESPVTTTTAMRTALPTIEDTAPYSVAPALRTALVNIICYSPRGSGLKSISGSGITIDSKGIILTNAHVAEYFLLADRGVDCRIRTGGPAADRYRAALIYISPRWLQANATVITQVAPVGTGEDDFALLAVTSSIGATEFPDAFPSVPLSTEPAVTGNRVAVASYGGEFLAYDQVQSSLYPTVVFSTVEDLFTFGTDTIDMIALGGSSAAQEGSSGGGVADASGKLVATLTTSTTEGDTTERSLHAITAPYVRREYMTETGQSLDTLLSQPTTSSIMSFSSQLPALESRITEQLP